MKANEVLNFGKEILISNSKNRKSIYKNSLFEDCKTDKEKKYKMKKVRNAFIGVYLN